MIGFDEANFEDVAGDEDEETLPYGGDDPGAGAFEPDAIEIEDDED